MANSPVLIMNNGKDKSDAKNPTTTCGIYVKKIKIVDSLKAEK